MPRWAVLLAVVALNPLLYAWWHTAGGAFPDSVAYLLMSRAIVEHGDLFLAHYGHVDAGLILPPLYPLAVGAASAIYPDPILVSQWLNGLALLLATIPLFLWVEKAANAWVAAAAVLAVQWQPFYVVHGTSTLTEAFFVLGICTLAYWAGTLLTRPARSAAPFLLLGAGIGALFLVRQIGLFMLPTLIGLVVLLDWRSRPRPAIARTLATAAMLVLGFTALTGPYAWALHAQTGKMPWTQSFRLNQYAVQAPAGAGAPAADAPSTYAEMYAGRRELRKLLPDASEMEGYALRGAPPAAGVRDWLATPAGWLANLWANTQHAVHLLGALTVILAAAGVALAALRPGAAGTACWRLLMPAALAGYFAVLSVLTGLVERYVEVMLPLLIAQAAVGLYLTVTATAAAARLPRVAWLALAVAIVGLVMLSAPTSLLATPLSRKVGEKASPITECSRLVREGEGVFSFHPVEAYLLGGSHRIIPNDSLQRIATYGRRTGTRWLLFQRSNATDREILLYGHATWLSDVAELAHSEAFVPRCGVPALGAVLFEITGDLPAPKTE